MIEMKELGEQSVDYSIEMTNDEYREELRKMFDNINENYKLRWFYRFVVEKIKSSG